MPRPTLTYTEVSDAATQLLEQGETPTVLALRKALGFGSNTTLLRHLQRWKTEQKNDTPLSLKENLPAEIITTIKNVWGQLVEHADVKIRQIQISTDETLAVQQQTMEILQKELGETHKKLTALEKQYDQLLLQKTTADETIIQHQKETIQLHEHIKGQQEQLAEKESRIQELHRLHQRVQQNLEHYREQSREERLLDQQRYEQSQQQLEQNILALRHELTRSTQAYTLLTTELSKTQSELEHSKLTQQHLKEQLDSQVTLLNSQHEKHQQIKKELNEQSQLTNVANTQIAVLSQQLQDVKNREQQLIEDNKQLTDEKWQLHHEKNQLLFLQQKMNLEEEETTT